MSFVSEFKTFALKGNVIDMATGIVVGVAFGKIISALVEGIIMPPIGLLIGGIDFSAIKMVIKSAGADGKGEVAIMWGNFFNTVFTFIIIALVIFMVIKLVNRMVKKQEAAPAPPPAEVVLLTEIRDLLRAK